jgi:hypothetical protein
MTPLEWALLSAMGIGLSSIGAFTASTFRTELRSLRDAIALIPGAIGKFEVAIVGVETRTMAKLDAHGQLLAEHGRVIEGMREDMNRRLSSTEDTLHATTIEVVRATGASAPDLSEAAGRRVDDPRRDPTGKHRALR